MKPRKSPSLGGGTGSNQYQTRGVSQTAARVAASFTAEDVDRLENEAVANAFMGSSGEAPAGVSVDHALRIASEMAPDPKEFKFVGRVVDAGEHSKERCACGATIRYVFTVQRARDGKEVNIGSTCIHTSVPFLVSKGAEGLAGDLIKAYEQHKEALEEAIRNARDERNLTVVEALGVDYDEVDRWIEQQHDAMKAEGKGLWRMREKYPDLERPALASTPGRTASSMRRRYATWWRKQAALGHTPPIPADETTREKVFDEVLGEHARRVRAAALHRERHAKTLAEDSAKEAALETKPAYRSWTLRSQERLDDEVAKTAGVVTYLQANGAGAGITDIPGLPSAPTPASSVPTERRLDNDWSTMTDWQTQHGLGGGYVKRLTERPGSNSGTQSQMTSWWVTHAKMGRTPPVPEDQGLRDQITKKLTVAREAAQAKVDGYATSNDRFYYTEAQVARNVKNLDEALRAVSERPKERV